MRRMYVASSWRNAHHPPVVKRLRVDEQAHERYLPERFRAARRTPWTAIMTRQEIGIWVTSGLALIVTVASALGVLWFWAEWIGGQWSWLNRLAP